MADSYTQGTIMPMIPTEIIPPNLAGRLLMDLDFTQLLKEADIEIESLATMNAQSLWEAIGGECGVQHTEQGVEVAYLYLDDHDLGEIHAHFLLELLRDLPAEVVPFLYGGMAHTCSKLRPDEFGGSAVFITRERGIEWTSTFDWLSKRRYAQEAAVAAGTQGPKDPWQDDPQYPRVDWQAEVAANDTCLGYQEWVDHQKEESEPNAGDSHQQHAQHASSPPRP